MKVLALLLALLLPVTAAAQTATSTAATGAGCARCERHLIRTLQKLSACQEARLAPVAVPGGVGALVGTPVPGAPAQLEITHKTETPTWVWWTVGILAAGTVASVIGLGVMASNASEIRGR